MRASFRLGIFVLAAGLASPVFALDKSELLLCASVDVHECIEFGDIGLLEPEITMFGPEVGYTFHF